MLFTCILHIFLFALLCVGVCARYPSELISRIRFYHLQDRFFELDGEKALAQSETYFAQDLAESIEDACLILGMTQNRAFLPMDDSVTFGILQRMGRKYEAISMNQLQALTLFRAYEVFQRQRFADVSAIVLDDLEADWLEWWHQMMQATYPALISPLQN